MRFAATEDEIMVEDMLDRALREARDGAPRVDGHAPRPDPDALRAQLGSLGLWGAWLPEAAGGSDGGPRLLMTLARGLGRVPTHHGLIGGCVLPGAILSRTGREDTLELVEQMAGGAGLDRPGPCARWSGTKCNALHPAGRARERHRSGRHPGSGGTTRNDRPPPRRAPAQAW